MVTDTGRAEALKWWLILVTVLGVLASGGVLLARQLLIVPDPTSPSSRPAPSSPSLSSQPTPLPTPSPVAEPDVPKVVRAAAGPLLPGVGAGEVFLQAATGIFRVEFASGRVTRTPTPPLEQFSSFVAGPSWVVFKTVDDPSGVVVKNGRSAMPLPPGLQPNGRLYPAPKGDLWLTPEEPTGGTRTLRRVDIDGRPVNGQTIRLPEEGGILLADGAGYLISANAGGVYQYRPSGPRRLASGGLIAAGARHLLVWDCDQRARCNPYRVARAGGDRTQLPSTRTPLLKLYQGDPGLLTSFGGELSPDGAHVALYFPSSQSGWGPLAVLDLTTGKTTVVPGSLTNSNGNTQIGWTRNSRWLLAVTDNKMRGHDTDTGITRTIDITDEPLLHLAMAGTTGD